LEKKEGEKKKSTFAKRGTTSAPRPRKPVKPPDDAGRSRKKAPKTVKKAAARAPSNPATKPRQKNAPSLTRLRAQRINKEARRRCFDGERARGRGAEKRHLHALCRLRGRVRDTDRPISLEALRKRLQSRMGKKPDRNVRSR